VLGVLMIPVCYVAVRRLMGDRLDEPGRTPAGSAAGGGTGAVGHARPRKE